MCPPPLRFGLWPLPLLAPSGTLPDFALEISLAACAAAGSALDAAAAAQLLPRLTDAEATEAVLQRHPLVRGASGLVSLCTGTAENKRAWCSMLRDLFSAAGQTHRGIVPASAGFKIQDKSNERAKSICASSKDQCLDSQRLLDYQQPQGKKGFGAPLLLLL